jgi:hypothetical protein
MKTEAGDEDFFDTVYFTLPKIIKKYPHCNLTFGKEQLKSFRLLLSKQLQELFFKQIFLILFILIRCFTICARQSTQLYHLILV